MKRGDIWTVAGGKDCAGKPRPVVIVQDDSFDATDSTPSRASSERPRQPYLDLAEAGFHVGEFYAKKDFEPA